MLHFVRYSIAASLIAAAFLAFPAQGFAASAAEIDRDAKEALTKLYADSSEAKELAKRATGILMFPKIIKGGLIIGAQGGDGALLQDGKTNGYYRSVAVSYGLQAGVQWFGYALFFMSEDALGYLDRSDGWELGVGPSIVVVDKGAAGGVSTTTGKEEIYAFIFEQEGLMAGLGLQGTKITKIDPDP